METPPLAVGFIHFEKEIVCPICGIISINKVELTELGQTQMTELFFSSFKH